MMIAGTPLMPASMKNRSTVRTSSANSPEARIARARSAGRPAESATSTSVSWSATFLPSVK